MAEQTTLSNELLKLSRVLYDPSGFYTDIINASGKYTYSRYITIYLQILPACICINVNNHFSSYLSKTYVHTRVCACRCVHNMYVFIQEHVLWEVNIHFDA